MRRNLVTLIFIFSLPVIAFCQNVTKEVNITIKQVYLQPDNSLKPIATPAAIVSDHPDENKIEISINKSDNKILILPETQNATGKKAVKQMKVEIKKEEKTSAKNKPDFSPSSWSSIPTKGL